MIRKEGIAVFLAVLIFAACSNGAGHGKVLDVTPEPEVSKLTLMVYMAADNDLESYALANLKAMERAECSGIKILVLLDRAEGYDETEGNWTDTRLFEVVHDSGEGSSIKSKRLDCPALGLSVTENTELDMGSGSVLRNFIEFGKNTYEAEKYALIIWGHGTGWRYCSENTCRNGTGRAVAIDDRSGSYMSVYNLGQAVRNQNLCVIGFDTCFGGVIENVYELKDCAEYTVACPGVTPSGGWDYKRFIEKLSVSSTSQNIAKCMAESSLVSATIFVNYRMSELFNSFESFSKELAGSINDSVSQLAVLGRLNGIKSYSYTQNPCDIYLDLLSLADLYSADTNMYISLSAKELKSNVSEVCLNSESGNTGIGVHFIPKMSSGALAATHSVDYLKDVNRKDQGAFIKESQWWVPTVNGKSDSVLDKLFYNVY